ncbi:rab-like protein 3 [Saccoglossus kowalevskii]|uniref:Rab-like protein 3-like n=1 Tax=Saccoglossus kowalevskii TaxID=10224 RepID=A0ABM0M7U0_SACKO|nr:PREDICTED: rab-like protein 3-like [Saccoglossus kowalevskii]
MAAIDIDKVRILVVGDSGVGKSSLVHLVCHSEPIANASWTIGAAVDVKVHEYKEGTPSQKTYFLEFWDVGGSANHTKSRHIFFNPVHGLILVHDLTNRKSHLNLRKWLAEVLAKDSNGAKIGSNSGSEYDPERFAGSHIPILVVGTKMDQIDPRRESVLSRSSPVAEECGADEINLDCMQSKDLAAGTSKAVKFSRFFDKVIERRFFAKDPFQSVSTSSYMYTDRRRPVAPQYISKTCHQD